MQEYDQMSPLVTKRPLKNKKNKTYLTMKNNTWFMLVVVYPVCKQNMLIYRLSDRSHVQKKVVTKF